MSLIHVIMELASKLLIVKRTATATVTVTVIVTNTSGQQRKVVSPRKWVTRCRQKKVEHPSQTRNRCLINIQVDTRMKNPSPVERDPSLIIAAVTVKSIRARARNLQVVVMVRARAQNLLVTVMVRARTKAKTRARARAKVGTGAAVRCLTTF